MLKDAYSVQILIILFFLFRLNFEDFPMEDFIQMELKHGYSIRQICSKIFDQ